MNKVKIMLTAITVFAVVGGALAFKAKKSSLIYCSATATLKASATAFDNSTFTVSDFGTSYCTTSGGTTANVKATIAAD